MNISISRAQSILNCLKRLPPQRRCYEGGYCSYREDCCSMQRVIKVDQGSVLAGAGTRQSGCKTRGERFAFPPGRYYPFYPPALERLRVPISCC